MYNYVCPNCKTRIESSIPLTYCICGGKYGLDLSGLMAAAESMFGKDNPFSVRIGEKR